MSAPGRAWTGEWVSRRLDVVVPSDPGADGSPAVRDLVGLAVRRNPRRAHLLVSRVLGKHVPTDPRLVRAAATLLGNRVAALLRGTGPHDAALLGTLTAALRDPSDAAVRDLRDRADATARAGSPTPCRVLGYAETATGLGHAVADALDADLYLHSTRRTTTGVPAAGGFAEHHSHATEHLLLPADPAALASREPLVLVDDELSTGRTAAETVRALHHATGGARTRYVVAALVDVRDPREHDELTRVATELGVRVDVVALARGVVGWSADTARRGAEVVAGLSSAPHVSVPRGHDPEEQTRGGRRTVWLAPPTGVAEGGRHGLDRAARAALEASLPGHVDRLAALLADGGDPRRVAVLGTEELMHLPLRLAEGLADRFAGRSEVAFSSTTRSPVLAVDDDGYAIRNALRFPAHEAGAGGERYAYNLAPDPAGGRPERWDAAVVVVDDAARTAALHAPGGLVPTLAGVADRVLEVVVPTAVPGGVPATVAPPVPLRGPRFGSYAPDEVAWLLTDLSPVPLEAPTAQRERAVRTGRAHYAESLPIEYEPGPEYRELFAAALDRAAPRIARAVARVTDALLAETGPDLVLASLARAGTPIGVLMRRWAGRAHGLDLPHYALSIVRGRGIDETALDAIATWHDPAAVRFVDGWTGKGAIADELAAALRDRPGWDPVVAVLADPGHATSRHGTREDFLVPSACLNSTVSGLVSRTVLRTDLVPPGGYHGAKFYAELAGSDVSARFLDAVTAHFPDRPAGGAPPPAEAPDRRGRDWARALADHLGVADLNLVKPGVGETTRVLLRRMPGLVLVRDDAGPDVDHVLVLARERGVPVHPLPERLAGVDAPYRCVGVVDPGATGAGS